GSSTRNTRRWTRRDPGALFRLLIVSLLFALNFFALVGVLFRGQSSTSSLTRNNSNPLCAHRFSYGLLCLLLNAYLGTWIPYLLSSFLHSTVWPLLEVRTHCAIQHLATTQVSTALLAILCLQKIFETFASRRAKLLSAAIFFTWIFPQSLYTVISELISSAAVADNEDSADSLYFLDAGNSAGQAFNFALQRADHQQLHPHQHSHHHQQQQQLHQLFSQGVLFCLHRLNYNVISSMTWHYVVLVVPLTSVFIICAGSKQFAKNSVFAQPNHNSIDSSSQSLPLDLCAHLLLFLLAAVLPFSTQFGLLACCNNSRKEKDEVLEFDIETSAQASISAALKSQILGLSSAATVPHQHQLTGRPAY
ncbi:hypothetical protein TYRP_007849, partial [Tyrophagus putrescentiae]